MLIPDLSMAMVERLGGWAVVIWMVAWMRSSITKLIEASETNMRAVIAEFRAFRLQEQAQHEELEKRQDEILEQVRRRGR